MLNLLILATLQSALLALGQIMLKLGLARMAPFGWNKAFWMSVLTNWQFAFSGICFATGSLLWMYIIKRFPLSMAYPMISLSYVFSLIGASVVFHEHIGLNKWLGVALIMVGCSLVAK